MSRITGGGPDREQRVWSPTADAFAEPGGREERVRTLQAHLEWLVKTRDENRSLERVRRRRSRNRQLIVLAGALANGLMGVWGVERVSMWITVVSFGSAGFCASIAAWMWWGDRAGQLGSWLQTIETQIAEFEDRIDVLCVDGFEAYTGFEDQDRGAP